MPHVAPEHGQQQPAQHAQPQQQQQQDQWAQMQMPMNTVLVQQVGYPSSVPVQMAEWQSAQPQCTMIMIPAGEPAPCDQYGQQTSIPSEQFFPAVPYPNSGSPCGYQTMHVMAVPPQGGQFVQWVPAQQCQYMPSPAPNGNVVCYEMMPGQECCN